MSTTSELVERLKAPANWLRQDRGEHWKSVSNIYDRAPFEAAARLDELERENAALREALQSSEAWLTGWGLHVGNCRGWRSDDACTCGLVAIRHEARAALAGSVEK
jgi:malate synthase